MLPLYAMGMLVCILFCGLTIDIGQMELLKIQMQNASDAAAIGAELASETAKSGSSNWTASSQWVQSGQADAALNGFANGRNNTTVTIAQNPTSGAYTGRYDAIQATITRTYFPVFMSALNGGSWTLSTQSVALVPSCFYALGGQSYAYSYTFWNASASLIATCPVYINYSFVVDGFAKGWGFGFNVSGPASASAPTGWTTQQTQSGYGGVPPSQGATYGVPVQTDPLLSYIPIQPSFNGTCAKTSYNLYNSTATLNPGNYCGTSSTAGMTITNSTVTLNPGLYIITGGANWTHSTITGTGVTLFFTKGGSALYGQLNVASNSGGISTITLSASQTTAGGAIPGVLFFCDRSWTTSNGTDVNFQTNTQFSGDGIWYLPNTGVYLWANSFNIPNYGGWVVRNTYYYLSSVGAAQDYSWLSGGSPFRTQSVLVQ